MIQLSAISYQLSALGAIDPLEIAGSPVLQSDRGLLIALGALAVFGIGYCARWILSDRKRLVDENMQLNSMLREQVGQQATLISQCTIALTNNTNALNQIAALMTERERKMVEVMQTHYLKNDAVRFQAAT